MRLLALLVSPAFIELLALFLSIVWMLRDERDKTRPFLVFALTLNLFFSFLLTFFMGTEGSRLPWKYDHILFNLDQSLGISAAAIARPLQFLRIPLMAVYQWMVPMMICWFLATRKRTDGGSVVLAYVGELVAGPMLYAIVPGCGPIYAFGANWLHPPTVDPHLVQVAGMPNAFPSLHIGTALVFCLFAPTRLWRAVALAFLIATFLATLATGEHYVIDLVPGLAFGCFAACIGYRQVLQALSYLGLVLSWSLAVRFKYVSLILHPVLLRIFALITIAVVIATMVKHWRTPASRKSILEAAYAE